MAARLHDHISPVGAASPAMHRYARDPALLLLYAFGFVLTHSLAGLWAVTANIGLWCPAAGLRLALL